MVNEGIIIKVVGLENLILEENKAKLQIRLFEKENVLPEKGNKEGCEHASTIKINKGKTVVDLHRNFKVSVDSLIGRNKDFVENMFLRITVTTKKG